MKTLIFILKSILLVIANAVPFVVDTMLYRVGGMLDIVLFIPVISGITLFNFWACDNPAHCIVMQSFMAVCIVCSSYVTTKLYYNNCSNDYETLMVGQTMALIGVATVVAATVVVIELKSRKRNKN